MGLLRRRPRLEWPDILAGNGSTSTGGALFDKVGVSAAVAAFGNRPSRAPAAMSLMKSAS
jgi:hypothetical protein